MPIRLHIPKTKGRTTTLEKIDQFVPVSIVETRPMPVEFVTFMRDNVQVRVKPFDNPKYAFIICAACDISSAEARWLKWNKEDKTIVFTRCDNGAWNCTIDAATVTANQFFN